MTNNLETLGRNRDDYLIMAGDWNAVLDNLDKMGGAGCRTARKQKLSESHK